MTVGKGRVVVIGDAMLDIDLDGRATRLSPEAPVPVLDDLAEHARPGGAALAAAMAARDGHEVVLVTALGDDMAGTRVRELLTGVTVHRLRYDGPTAVKKRVRADGQPLLRLDSGSIPGTLTVAEEEVAAAVVGAAAVLVCDYGRGVTAAPPLRRALERLPRRVPLVWDPHPRGSAPVPGAGLVTPNRAEAELFAERLGMEAAATVTRLAATSRHAETLVSGWQVQSVAVTLGAGGALLSYGEGPAVVAPAPSVVCVDASGAGDRFAVTAARGLAEGQLTSEAVQTAVAEAAAYVAAGGPASIFDATGARAHAPADGTAEALLAAVSARGGTVVATGGCFDLLHAGHVATLREARRLGDCLVVCLNSDESVRRLKGPSRPLVPATDRARVLQALEFVDAVVVFDEDTPAEALRRIRPHVWVKGGDYAGAHLPEAAILDEWGGQTVVLPYLPGRSTTELVRAAAVGPPPTPTTTAHGIATEKGSLR